jgi:hypothetical protein
VKHQTFGEIEVYAVGLLADLRRLVHSPEPLPQRIRRFRFDLGYPRRQARARNWRAVKNYLNGYLCEPAVWPSGVTRCGTGWTRGRAYRDLARRAEKAGATVRWEAR